MGFRYNLIVAIPKQIGGFSLGNQSITDLYNRFDADDLQSNVRFARRTGVSEIYFWGIEWWFYLKMHGQGELWETAKLIIKDSK